MRDWINIGVPDVVATHQMAWERRHLMLRMYDCGFTLKQIGAANGGITRQTASLLVKKARREYGHRCPVEMWMNQNGDIHELFRRDVLRQYWHSHRWQPRSTRNKVNKST
jgi:hypothetical protein